MNVENLERYRHWTQTMYFSHPKKFQTQFKGPFDCTIFLFMWQECLSLGKWNCIKSSQSYLSACLGLVTVADTHLGWQHQNWQNRQTTQTQSASVRGKNNKLNMFLMWCGADCFHANSTKKLWKYWRQLTGCNLYFEWITPASPLWSCFGLCFYLNLYECVTAKEATPPLFSNA